MYEDLLSINGVVDFSPSRALDKARTFLERQGYTVLSQTVTTLTVERRGEDHAVGTGEIPRLVVIAVPQPQGGVKIKVAGTDREGVHERQGLWALWAEGLPMRAPALRTRVKVVEAKDSSGGFSRTLRSRLGGLFSRGTPLRH